MKDTELIHSYQKTKDQKYLQQLFLSYQPVIFRQCMSILKHAQDSEDACIDIFIELKEKLQVHQVTYFPSWLYMFVRNFCLKKIRKKSKMIIQSLEKDFEKSEIFENLDHITEMVDLLPDGLEELKEDQRWCIVLFYLHGKSYAEIEELKGFTFKKIKSSIQHGKKNLKKILIKNAEKSI